MTNKTTMPEALLVADRRVHGYVRFTAKGRLDFSRYPDGTKFITTDQAEAYADARVREALEAAAKICDDRAMKNEAAVSADEADEASSLRSAAWQIGVCAHDIRALIPEPCLNSP